MEGHDSEYEGAEPVERDKGKSYHIEPIKVAELRGTLGCGEQDGGAVIACANGTAEPLASP